MDGIKPVKNNLVNDRYQLGQSAISIAKKAGMGAMSGGVGRAAERVAQAATADMMARGAESLAKSSRLARFRRRNQKDSDGKKVPAKKLSGPAFWIMVGLTVTKDMLDIFLTMTVFLSLLIIPVTLFITFAVLVYYTLNSVSPTFRKAIAIGLSLLLETLPFLSLLPTATISLFVVKYLENHQNKKTTGVLSFVNKVAA